MQSVLIMTCNTHLQALNLLYSYNKIGPSHVALVNRLQEIYPGMFVFRIFFFFFTAASPNIISISKHSKQRTICLRLKEEKLR